MPDLDVQALTLVEALLLLLSNGTGAALARLAWRVSDVDVREARAWQPPATVGAVERTRLRHNRRVVTLDLRYGEVRRFQAHLLIALVGVFWLLTPQPTNPQVVWWAVGIRAVVIGLSLLLIDKTLHHLVARFRFDRPELAHDRLRDIGPALVLAWRDAAPPEDERAAGGRAVRRDPSAADWWLVFMLLFGFVVVSWALFGRIVAETLGWGR